MTKQPTLGVIILNCFNAEDTVIEAEQAIKDLLLSKLPKEKREPATANPLQGMIELAEVDGYNQAIDEITKIIKEEI